MTKFTHYMIWMFRSPHWSLSHISLPDIVILYLGAYLTSQGDPRFCWKYLNGRRRSLWQSPKGKRWLTHWASMLRWRWSISEYNLTTRDSPKWTLNMKWYSPSQVPTAKHASYPQLTATKPVILFIWYKPRVLDNDVQFRFRNWNCHIIWQKDRARDPCPVVSYMLIM